MDISWVVALNMKVENHQGLLPSPSLVTVHSLNLFLSIDDMFFSFVASFFFLFFYLAQTEEIWVLSYCVRDARSYYFVGRSIYWVFLILLSPRLMPVYLIPSMTSCEICVSYFEEAEIHCM